MSQARRTYSTAGYVFAEFACCRDASVLKMSKTAGGQAHGKVECKKKILGLACLANHFFETPEAHYLISRLLDDRALTVLI